MLESMDCTNDASSQPTLYDILGCPQDSSTEKLKEAYHSLILKHHPDKNSDTDTSTFHNIQRAWDILSNPEQRKEYDIKIAQADFDSECVLIFAKINSKELEPTEDSEILSYPCRCGSNYQVHIDDLLEKNCVLHIPCEDCTFVIIVDT
ncbi:hypothetical protein TKK_0006310 [Trichogramma kaykai]|uniref:J domain-containing protein n=1 Tax=Trichogramma kaykai TaxID=54128 RepID=A0ABD2XF46_9HYME